VLETALLFVYAERGVDDLSQTYVGYFAVSLPVIVLWLGLGSLVDLVRSRLVRLPGRTAIACSLVALAFIPSITTGTFANPYRGTPAMMKLSDAIGPRPVRLEFTTSGWPVGLGLVEERRRQGRPVCVVGAVWTIIATAPVICSSKARGELVSVLGPGDAPVVGGHELLKSGTTDLVEIRH
jgi:hypothetical protein